jgi:ABC-type Fe3+-hydroxamate transport system substrate-binding protein
MATRVVVDDLGHEQPLPAAPSRIVSLVPSLSETLWWWHLADRVVAVTDWCVAPPRAFDHAARVRGTKNPDVGRIVELAPDLVVADQEENRELDVRRLREAGVAVVVTRVRGLDDAVRTLTWLGQAVGAGSAGAATAQAIARAADQLGVVAAPLRTFCPVWRDGVPEGADPDGEVWWATGRATFAGDLLRRAGFAVVPDDPSGRYPRLPLAEVRSLDPDVVLLPDEPYVFGEADRAVFRGWRARTRLLDGTALTWWGPRTPHALGDLARLARQLRGRRRVPSRPAPEPAEVSRRSGARGPGRRRPPPRAGRP